MLESLSLATYDTFICLRDCAVSWSHRCSSAASSDALPFTGEEAEHAYILLISLNKRILCYFFHSDTLFFVLLPFHLVCHLMGLFVAGGLFLPVTRFAAAMHRRHSVCSPRFAAAMARGIPGHQQTGRLRKLERRCLISRKYISLLPSFRHLVFGYPEELASLCEERRTFFLSLKKTQRKTH
jgi:hypothetical protein